MASPLPAHQPSAAPPGAPDGAERLRVALHLAGVGTWEYDVATAALRWDAACHAVHGVAPEAFDGSMDAFWAVVVPEDRPAFEALMYRAAEDLRPYVYQYRVRRPSDGALRWVQGRGVWIRDAAGALTLAAGSCVDVTERVEADTALAASEERLALALGASGAQLWDFDVRSRTVRGVDGLAALLGYGPGELADTEAAWGALIHPDDMPRVRTAFAAHVAGATPRVAVEYRMRHADGRWLWVAVLGQVVAREADGAPRRLVGTVTDETVRHQTTEALAERDVQLALALTAARLGSWSWDVGADVAEYSASMGPLFGLPPGERHVTHAEFLAAVHPDDRPLMMRAMERALAGDDGYHVICRIVTPGGEERLHENHARLYRDGTGRPLRVVGIVRDVTEEHRRATALAESEAALRRSEARLRAISASNPLGLFAADRDGRVRYANGRLVQLWDATTPAEIHGLGWLARVHPDDRRPLLSAWRAALAAHAEFECEYRLLRADGSERRVLGRSAPLRLDDGTLDGVVGTIEDVTERRALEAQLRQAQKMEAVGRLAGGVAHDFNNLLTVIGGSLEFARAGLDDEHPVQAELREIGAAAERARRLVRQLLAFGRQQVLDPRPLDPNAVVRDAERLLVRVIGEEIRLETECAADVPRVLGDRGQLEQVLLNLAVNARDAMLTARHGRLPLGGTLTLATGTETLDAAAALGWELPPGRYARLVVRDTGHGMTEAERARAFEPFFTTKAVGGGTGLGLATVYGIVTQSGGGVRVASAPGAGTTFTILLPAHDAATTHAAQGPTPVAATWAVPGPSMPRGTLLLVEDEGPVRATTRRMLERGGWRVVEAGHGGEALARWAEHDGDFAAVVSDLRMPVLGGEALARRLRTLRPDLPVLFLSGYADALPDGEAFVPKPFSADALLAGLARAEALRVDAMRAEAGLAPGTA